MTNFRRQRVLNPIDSSVKSQSRSETQSIPSSTSKSSISSKENNKKNSNQSRSRNTKKIKKSARRRKRREKVIMEYDEEAEIQNVDPRRLSLDEHPLMMHKLNQSIYSETCDDSQYESPNPRRQSQKLTSLLEHILNDDENKCHEQNQPSIQMQDEVDYFDDDLDEDALLMALDGIDEQKPKQMEQAQEQVVMDETELLHRKNSKIIKRLSFDKGPSTPPFPSQTSTAPIDFSPHSKRKVNSPLSQKTNSRSQSIPSNSNMGSMDIMTQQSTQYTQQRQQQPLSDNINDRYYRFQVIEVFNVQYQRTQILRVKDLTQCTDDDEEDEDVDIEQNKEWTIELREDWYESIISENDVIHVIGETVETMRKLFIEEQQQSNQYQQEAFPIYMIPNENIPIIIDTSFDIIIDNLHNYLIIHPDCLMIPSRIAASYPCPRTQVLAANINAFEQSTHLLYGTMAHELFQETLQRGKYNEFDIKQDIDYIISKYLIELYSLHETEQTAKERLCQFLPNVADFFGKYRDENNDNIVDWSSYKQRLQITKVVDIEESIWSPMFGIQGNIDATLQVKTKRYLSGLEQQHRYNGKLTQNNTINPDEFLLKLLPFELKTGKESITSKMKARAQLAMYTLMLADRYDTATEGGLLYYLKTGHLMGIPLPHNEIRALLIRRNLLAKYFNSHVKINKDPPQIEGDANNTNHNESQSKLKRIQKEFPPLLRQKRECLNCFKKQECFIYHKMQCYNQGIDDISNDNITSDQVYTDLVSHLSENHLKYINKWIELIDLEETYCLGTRYEIWAMTSMQRESKTGKCLANMIIAHHEFDQFKHIYTFIKHPDYRSNDNHENHSSQHGKDRDIIKLWDLKFRVNERIVIGTEDGKYGLCKGTIIELNTKYVKFASYKPIKDLSTYSSTQRNDVIRYRLDIDDAAYGYSALRANIFYYFFAPPKPQKDDNHNDNEDKQEMYKIVQHKRKLLVDLIEPKFTHKPVHSTDIPLHLETAYNELNIDQQNAVKHVLKCNDYALILGMPGTGKSSTIIFLLRLLVSFGYKVMLSAYTNSAIDHLCLKLLKYNDVKNKLVRIGSSLSINSKLSNYILDKSNKNKFDTISSIAQFIGNKAIFAVTSTSSTTHSLLSSSQIFDYCIIDEAGQLTEPQVLGPLRKCRRFILVGDNNQLPPLVQCRDAEERGLSVSLFEKLAKKYSEIAVKALTIQYRMNKDILLLSNSLIYNGKMKCASDIISNQQIKLNKPISRNLPFWIKHTIDPKQNVILLNTDKLYTNDEKQKKNEGKNVNDHEANMIEMIVHNLFKFGIYSSQIGIMAPYRSQLKLIKTKLDKLNVPLSPSQTEEKEEEEEEENDNDRKRESSLLLDTIDRFQGSDRDIIMISFTHTRYDKKVGQILHDWRRINVALTRAKCKLILIASVIALKQSKSNILSKIVDITNEQKWIYHIDSY